MNTSVSVVVKLCFWHTHMLSSSCPNQPPLCTLIYFNFFIKTRQNIISSAIYAVKGFTEPDQNSGSTNVQIICRRWKVVFAQRCTLLCQWRWLWLTRMCKCAHAVIYPESKHADFQVLIPYPRLEGQTDDTTLSLRSSYQMLSDCRSFAIWSATKTVARSAIDWEGWKEGDSFLRSLSSRQRELDETNHSNCVYNKRLEISGVTSTLGQHISSMQKWLLCHCNCSLNLFCETSSAAPLKLAVWVDSHFI